MRFIRTLFVTALAAVLFWFGWSQWQARTDAERRAENAETTLGLAASRVVSISFERSADVRVATLRGKIAARSEYDGAVFHPKQITTAPFTLEYFLPLSSIGRKSYRWDATTKTLTIDAPDVITGDPNIDFANAVAKQNGIFISRKASIELARQA